MNLLLGDFLIFKATFSLKKYMFANIRKTK